MKMKLVNLLNKIHFHLFYWTYLTVSSATRKLDDQDNTNFSPANFFLKIFCEKIITLIFGIFLGLLLSIIFINIFISFPLILEIYILPVFYFFMVADPYLSEWNYVGLDIKFLELDGIALGSILSYAPIYFMFIPSARFNLAIYVFVHLICAFMLSVLWFVAILFNQNYLEYGFLQDISGLKYIRFYIGMSLTIGIAYMISYNDIKKIFKQ